MNNILIVENDVQREIFATEKKETFYEELNAVQAS